MTERSQRRGTGGARILTDRYNRQHVRASLAAPGAWKPYPPARERKRWNAVPHYVGRRHIERAESRLGFEWPAFRPRLFLEYAQTGERVLYEEASRGHLCALSELILGECVEGHGRFVPDIVDGIWAICEQSYWGHPQHLNMQSSGRELPDTNDPVVNLYVGETASLLAWASYLLSGELDDVSPLIRRRIAREVEYRVLEPCLRREDFGWMGFHRPGAAESRTRQRRANNWNPWINSNWLVALLLCDDDRSRRTESVYKIMRSLDCFIDDYPDDGGCDEGPQYWNHAGASLFDALQILHSATEGFIDVFAEPKIVEIGRFIYRVHIAGRHYYGFSDSTPTPDVNAPLLYRYGQMIDDAGLTAMGRFVARETELAERGLVSEAKGRVLNLSRAVPAVFIMEELTTPAEAPLPRDSWLPDTQIMLSRDREGSADGFCLGAKGGNNAESHNHNDVGSFIVYLDGRPVLVDPGVESYGKKTFSAQRYELWTMQSQYHNLPTINGAMQMPGVSYRAHVDQYRCGEEAVLLALDLTRAYPAEAGIVRWTRSLKLERGRCVTVTDEYELDRPGGTVTFNLITPCAVAAERGGVSLSERAGPVSADARSAAVAWIGHTADMPDGGRRAGIEIETIRVDDSRLGPIWAGALTRVRLHVRYDETHGSHKLVIERGRVIV